MFEILDKPFRGTIAKDKESCYNTWESKIFLDILLNQKNEKLLFFFKALFGENSLNIRGKMHSNFPCTFLSKGYFLWL